MYNKSIIKRFLVGENLPANTEKRSNSTGRLLCSCGKGYATEDENSPHYGKCRPCWVKSLTRREMKIHGIKSRC